VEVYTESMAEQTSRRQHLLFVVPPGSISQLLHAVASGENLPQLLLFPIFSPSAVRQSGEQHIYWGNKISKSLLFSYVAFSNLVSPPSNSSSDSVSFQSHVYVLLSPWKAELTRNTTTRGRLIYVTVLKPKQRHKKWWRNSTKGCCSCL